jgi:AraC-like DNA-binding protein
MDVSGPACIYAHVHVGSGLVSYVHGEERVAAPTRYAVVMPPFSVVQAVLDRCEVTSVAFALQNDARAHFPADAILLEDPGDPPTSPEDVLQRLSARDNGVLVRRDRDAPQVARTAKAILDKEYATSLTITRVAKEVHASPALLSRLFKNAYGVPPVQYRHLVRIMDALMRFASGSTPVDVFQDVGFEDLSRFYKIFRKVACAAPGSYRPRRLRNAKT